MFCSGFGIDLQKWDSDIVEYIVSDFTERNIPILYINESFIIWKEQIDLLVNNMHTAIKWVTGIVEHPELKYDQFITLAWKDHKLNYVDKILFQEEKGGNARQQKTLFWAPTNS